MAETEDLLIEVGTEELPPQALSKLSAAFEQGLADQLQQAGFGHSGIERFASPRRLALRIGSLQVRQADQEVVRKGPAVKAAFDGDGNATKAAQGFARSCGVSVDELDRESTPKGDWLVFRKTEPGKSIETKLAGMVEQALDRLPIPKRMRWGDLDTEFVRPVHWILLLLGDKPVEGVVKGLPAGNTTRGHRFHHPETISIGHPNEYDSKLREVGYVEPSFDARRQKIKSGADQAAADIGAKAIIEEGLLDETTALNEWPVPVVGSFDEDFLDVPAEALIETMQKHQKYFPVVDNEGNLKPNFITISNIESKDPAQVRAGNERVIRPRFKDAAFFWEQDRKTPLDSLSSRLEKVVYQDKLGSIAEKCERIAGISTYIAEQTGYDVQQVKRASKLCKCDLLTDMVGEFASLQGTMGRYYAQAAGEHSDVALAMEQHYLPRHAGDALPGNACGQAIAIADRLDSLVGIFAIGQKPTGVKDPFALRRASLGALRILIETPLELDLNSLLEVAAKNLQGKVDAEGVVDEVFDYMMERLHGYYAEKGISGDVVEAVLAARPTVPMDIDKRVKAVSEFRSLPEAPSLAAANKRIRNILKKSDLHSEASISESLFEDDHEKLLHSLIVTLQPKVEAKFVAGEYREALTNLSTLKDAVDGFFDNVMVMCDDENIRNNRISLLSNLESLFSNVADFSILHRG